MGAIEVPVLIVGGGGCGLSASVFLSDHGVDHLLVERHADTSHVPKAHYLNQRTMEIYRQHGLDGEIFDQAAPLDKFGMVRWQTTMAGDGELDARVIHEMDAFGGGSLEERFAAAGPVLPAKLPQNMLEPIVRRHAEQRNPEGVLFSHELTSLSDEGDHVVAEVRNVDSGEITTVTAQYVIAADGGRTVGRMLGIEMQGRPGSLNVTTVYFAADLSPWWLEGTLITHLLHPDDPDLSSNLIEMGPTWGKHCENWGLHFASPNGERYDDQTIIPRIRELLNLPDLELDLHEVTHWTQQSLVAAHYRKGRVVIAGDAAHRQPPAVGLGLNTGIQDAHNLAWKLAVVLSERAGDNLIDTYESERWPVGKENVDWAISAALHHQVILDATGLGPNVAPGRRIPMISRFFDQGLLGETTRERLLEIFGTHRGGCQAHDMEVGFAYADGAVVADGSEPPPRVPMRDIHTPTSRPGHVLPHAWIERDGQRLSTHDLTGAATSFALITGPGGTPWGEAAAQVAEKFSIPIVAAQIGTDYADVDGGWAVVREISDDGAILVRPDNHVAWRSLSGSENPASVLAEAVAHILDDGTG